MGEYKIVLNSPGVVELLKSEEILDACEEQAFRAQSKLGDEYEVNSMVGKRRVNASIRTRTHGAKRDNIKNNTILKALGD